LHIVKLVIDQYLFEHLSFLFSYVVVYIDQNLYYFPMLNQVIYHQQDEYD
jgi:hypothetical protein